MYSIRLLATSAVLTGCANRCNRERQYEINGLQKEVASMEDSIVTRFAQVNQSVDLQLSQKSNEKVKMDLERLRKEMKAKGLENSPLDLEVQRMLDSIGSGAMTAKQKKELRKRTAEIDITLNDNPAEVNLRGVNS